MRRFKLLYALSIIAAATIAAALASCASDPTREMVAIERDMIVTAYCDCKACCGWKRTWYGKPVYASGPSKGEYKKPGRTASGAKARPGTVAAPPNYAFGTLMYIPGYGKGVVQDRGSAIQGEHLDVFFKKHKDALQWGRQKLRVKIYVPPGDPMLARR